MTSHLGDYVRELRHERRLTTRQLGTAAACSASFIARLEVGKRYPNLDTLWRIIEALEGDFGKALFLLCLDAGVPEDVAHRATTQEQNGAAHPGQCAR